MGGKEFRPFHPKPEAEERGSATDVYAGTDESRVLVKLQLHIAVCVKRPVLAKSGSRNLRYIENLMCAIGGTAEFIDGNH